MSLNQHSIAIAVNKLGKAYRIGIAQKKEDNLISALIKSITAPFRNFTQIKSLKNISAEATGTSERVKEALKKLGGHTK